MIPCRFGGPNGVVSPGCLLWQPMHWALKIVSPCFALPLAGFWAAAVPLIPAKNMPETGSNKAKE